MIYKLMILLHIIGVIIFFGNLMIAFLLMTRLRGEKSMHIVHHNLKLVNVADKWFTTISVILILPSGIAAAIIAGISIFGTKWILWSLIAFGVSGLLFFVRVLPLQLRMEKTAEQIFKSELNTREKLDEDQKKWMHWAGLASSAVLIAVIIMVFKPVF